MLQAPPPAGIQVLTPRIHLSAVGLSKASNPDPVVLAEATPVVLAEDHNYEFVTADPLRLAVGLPNRVVADQLSFPDCCPKPANYFRCSRI